VRRVDPAVDDAAPSLAAVRRAIRGADASALEAVASSALRDAGAAEVRARFDALLAGIPTGGLVAAGG
jgi:hypothetical protein